MWCKWVEAPTMDMYNPLTQGCFFWRQLPRVDPVGSRTRTSPEASGHKGRDGPGRGRI